MSNNKSNNKISIRKWIVISIFLFLIVGVGLIGGGTYTYVSTYKKTKVTPYSKETAVNISPNKITDFDFDFYCTEFNNPNEYEDSTTLKFAATIENAIENYTFTNVKYKVALGNRKWTGYYKEASSYTTIASTFKSTNSKTSEKINSFSGYDFKYPVKKLLFIKESSPDAFVHLSYIKTKTGASESTGTTCSYILTYSYKDYYRSGTTKLS